MSDSYQSSFESLFSSPSIPEHTLEHTLLASELGSPLLVSYLRRTSGEYIRHFSETFTNALKLSMHNQKIMDWVELDNGWTVKADTFELDEDKKTVFIPVVLSTNRILELQKADTTHPLVLELSVVKFMLRRLGVDISDYRFIIIAFDRLFTDYKAMPTKAINYIEPELLSLDDTEELLISYTDELQHHIDSCTAPAKCTDIKWHRRRGKSINMTCLRCTVSGSCKHFNSFSYTNAKLDTLIF